MSAARKTEAPPVPDGVGDSETVRLRDVTVLSDNWYTLRRYEYDLKRRDGEWQRQSREAYDRGDGVAILLYNRQARTIVLTRQFRMPAYTNGLSDGLMIEVPAGLLDDDQPAAAIRKEVSEETGFVIGEPKPLWDIFMSPGSVTERLHFFTAEYEPSSRDSQGGGNSDEGEDIEVIEVGIDEALDMIASGAIRDAKTIMLIQHARLAGLL